MKIDVLGGFRPPDTHLSFPLSWKFPKIQLRLANNRAIINCGENYIAGDLPC